MGTDPQFEQKWCPKLQTERVKTFLPQNADFAQNLVGQIFCAFLRCAAARGAIARQKLILARPSAPISTSAAGEENFEDTPNTAFSIDFCAPKTRRKHRRGAPTRACTHCVIIDQRTNDRLLYLRRYRCTDRVPVRDKTKVHSIL